MLELLSGRQSREGLAQFPHGIHGHYSCVWQNYMYVFGGRIDGNNSTRHVWRYDFISDTWERLRDIPMDRTAFLLKGDLVGNTIYFFGGFDDQYFLATYNLTNDTWNVLAQSGNSSGQWRRDHGVAFYNGSIYSFYGVQGSFARNNVLRYNLSTNSWSTVATHSSNRFNHSVVKMSNQIVVILGAHPNYDDRETTSYNIQTGELVSRSPAPESLFNVDGVTDHNANLHVLSTEGNLLRFSAFRTWSLVPNQPNFGNRTYFSMVRYNDDLYVLGGIQAARSVEFFKIAL